MMDPEPEWSVALDGVHKAYAGATHAALRGVSVQVRPGEVVGLLGPNGAGKSTLMKILSCATPVDRGEAKVLGLDVRTQADALRARVGYLPEHVPLFEEMMVWDYLGHMARLRGVRDHVEDRVEEVMREVGLMAMATVECRHLSKGYRQRVGLAQAIVHAPELLMLDEPTTALDPRQVREVRGLIRRMGEDRTVIFSTHILQEVAAVCDRVLILSDGELRHDARLADLAEQCDEADQARLGPHLEALFLEVTGSCGQGGEE